MTSTNNGGAALNAISGLLAAAAENTQWGGDIALATTQVIARRVAIGMAASFDPLQADRAEFSRMVPEKVEAFSTAGAVMMQQSRQTGLHMMHSASDEIVATVSATIEMSGCSSPAALAEAQGKFAYAWFARASSGWVAMGTRMFEAQAAAMAPIRRTVVANAERLGR